MHSSFTHGWAAFIEGCKPWLLRKIYTIKLSYATSPRKYKSVCKQHLSACFCHMPLSNQHILTKWTCAAYLPSTKCLITLLGVFYLSHTQTSPSIYVYRSLCLYTHTHHNTAHSACLRCVGILTALFFLNFVAGRRKKCWGGRENRYWNKQSFSTYVSYMK